MTKSNPSWAEANDDVAAPARAAQSKLNEAIEYMNTPHEAAEGCVVLELLEDAAAQLFDAIARYRDVP